MSPPDISGGLSADNTPTTVLSAGNRVEIGSTTQEEGEYDTLIQGSDRTYPAIILRRKDRGVGATLKTISKFGKYADLYGDYTEAIQSYLERKRKKQGSRTDHEGIFVSASESWLGEVVQSVVGGRKESDGDTGGI